jgi:hypothetical protein
MIHQSRVSSFIDSMAASWKVQVLGVHFVEMDVNVMTHLKGIFSLRPAYCMLAETKKKGGRLA